MGAQRDDLRHFSPDEEPLFHPAGAQQWSETIPAIFDQLPFMLVFYDARLLRFTLNHECERLIGYTTEEANRLDLLEALLPDPAYRQSIVDALASDPSEWKDIEITTKSGAVLTTSWTIAHLSGGSSVGIGLDVTYRAAADAELRKSEERFRAALAHSPTSVFQQNRDLRYTWVYNLPPGFSAEMFVGRTDREVLLPEEADALAAVKRGVLETGKTARVETSMTAGGTSFIYDLVIYPFREGGKIMGLTCAAHDVTQEKRAEQQLHALNAKLERRAAQLRALTAQLMQAEETERRRLARMLHDDLQQLQVGAKFSLDTLLVKGPEGEVRTKMEQARDLIDQAIEVARSLTGELAPPVLYETDFGAALRWLARWMYEKHGLSVTVFGDTGPDELPQDVRVLLFRAIRELLLNTTKHARVDRAEVTLTRLADGSIRVTVADKGVGYNPSPAAPAGFGLFSIEERVAAMGGRLEVESAPGRGTSTSITLAPSRVPAGPERYEAVDVAEEPVPEEEEVAVSQSRVRVVLADDHKIVREGLTHLIAETQDIAVIGEAADGMEAIQAVRRLHPDVVVMDITMPRMNGVTATREIKNEFPGCRIIALTMHPAADMKAEMMAAGADLYLDKSGPSDRLIRSIRDVGKKPGRSPSPE